MPKGSMGKIEKRMRKGKTVWRGLRGEQEDEAAECPSWINDIALARLPARDWWMPTFGEPTAERLWQDTWPRTEWVWGAPPHADGWTTVYKVEMEL